MGRHKALSISRYIVESHSSSVGLGRFGPVFKAAMAFSSLHLLFSAGVPREVARLSAEAMVGSFIQAAILIVVPAGAFLIWVSQKDRLERGR